MRIGVQIVAFGSEEGATALRERIAEIARAADTGGLHSLWIEDHFFQVTAQGQARDPMLEAYSLLGFLAGVTQRVKLGTLCASVTHRHPGVLVKAATSVDVLSGGRSYFGIGAGWYEFEHVGLGIPFPPLRERFERLEETLRIAKQMWLGGREPFEGRYTRMARAHCSPLPISQPHPPILVGGEGERKTLRLVAQYADACNFAVEKGIDHLAPKLEVLRRHCDAVGRDYEAIERTVLVGTELERGGEAPSEVIRRCRALAQLGFQHVIFMLPNPYERAAVERLAADVVPEAASF